MMRMKVGLRQFCVYATWLLEAIAFLLLGLVGYALDMDPVGFWATLVNWTTEWAGWIIACSGVVIVLARLFRRAFAVRSREMQILDRLVGNELDEFRKRCFPDVPPTEPLDNNRVTIFKHVQWQWWIWPWRSWCCPWGWGRGPGSGWLVVAYRSGHATQSSGTVFLAPDDAEQADGIAGQTWRRKAAYRVRGLPDLGNVAGVGCFKVCWLSLRARCGSTSSAVKEFIETRRQIMNYAEATSLPSRLTWQRKNGKKKLPLSMCGIPLESQQNIPVGVLVLDSCNTFESIEPDTRSFRTVLTRLTNRLHALGVLE